MKKRILSTLLAAVMILSALPLGSFSAAASDWNGAYDAVENRDPKVIGSLEQDGSLAEGALRLTKTAVAVAGMPNFYDITLRAEGKNLTVPTDADIVLVIDQSTSMNNSTECPIPASEGTLVCTKEEHQHTDRSGSCYAFTCTKTEHEHSHKQCCTRKGDHWICNTDKCPNGGQEHKHNNNSCYTLVCGKEAHTHDNNSCYVDRHVHASTKNGKGYCSRYEVAEYAMQQLVAGLRAQGINAKVSVVSFGTNVQTRIGLTSIGTDAGYASVQSAISEACAYVYNNGTYTSAGLDRAKSILDGDAQATEDTQRFVVLLSDGLPTYPNGGGSSTTEKDKEAMRTAANTLKANDYATVYSVAFDSDIDVMKDVASYIKDEDGNNTNRKKYYTTNDDTLTAITSDIQSEITKEIEGGAVTDPMGANIQPVLLDNGEVEIVAISEGGAVSYDSNKNTLSWNPGDITAAGGAFVTYRVKVDVEAKGFTEGLTLANGTTTIDYTDVNGREQQANFNVPKVAGTFGQFKKVAFLANAQGEPIDANGNVVALENAVILDTADEINSRSGANQWDYTAKQITSSGLSVDGFTQVTGNRTYPQSQQLTITPQEKMAVAYFPYTGVASFDLVKEYKDGSTVIGKTGDYAKFQLIAGGQVVKEITANGTQSFTGLAIGEYTLKESYTPNGFTRMADVTVKVYYENGGLKVKVGSRVVTSTYQAENQADKNQTVSVSGRKNWIDPADAVHPDITIKLLQNDSVIKTAQLKSGESEFAFNDLPKYDLATGEEYEYTVDEELPNGYTKAVEGTVITNTIQQEKISITGTKTWVDPQGTAHPAITIRLYQDNVEFKTTTLANGTTGYSFTGLDKYAPDGHEYKYTVTEDAVAGYTSAQDGYNFTNTINQEQISVSGRKTWVAPAGTVYPDVTINLLQDGKKIKEVKLTNGTTSYSFTGLPKYDLADGHVYKYTVTEDAVAGYTSTQDGNNFTNTINQEQISVSVTKRWVDPAGTVHPAITIDLLRDGDKVDSKTLANGQTSIRFEGLDKYDLSNGREYVYTVTEVPVEGYNTVISGSAAEGFTIINTIQQDSNVEVRGTKTWVDNNNSYNTRPDSITINLLQDGTKVGSKTLTNSEVEYSFTGLDKYALDGHAYEYTVTEDAVAGYTSAQDGYNFINTIGQDHTSVSGTKTWIDPQGTPHPDVTIQLLQNGQVFRSVKLQNGETEYEFTELPVYDLTTGVKYVYAIAEADVEGYTSSVSGYNVTNTINQEQISVSGRKTWIAPAGTEHPTITINLLQDDKEINSTTLANGTTDYSFTGLPKYDLTDGHEYKYTVTEDAVAGYTSTQDGNDFTNTIKQENLSISGTKTWVDPDGTVHPDVTINLLQDGKKIKEVKLTNGTTSYSFTGLPKYDLTDGHVYEYTVTEDAVAGYTSTQAGNDFTNTIQQEKISVTGTKTWRDPAGTKHPDVTIRLYQDNEEITSTKLTDGTTSYSFTGLDKYAPDGHLYSYTVSEDPVAGYTSQQSNYNFTNIIEQAYTTVSVTKTWRAPAGVVHPDVTINLLQNGTEIGEVTLENGKTTHTFENLQVYNLETGEKYVYTVSEDEVAGYTNTSLTGDAETGFVFLNTIKQETSVEVSVTKRWVAPADTQHPTITIQLLQNGAVLDSVDLENGQTSHTFTGLEKYDLNTGLEYVYTVTEAQAPGYSEPVITGNAADGFVITNTIAQDDSVSVSGTKTWIAPAGTDHPTITIRLYRDGKEINSTTLANGTTDYSFTGLPKYDLTDGHVYEYTVTEDEVEGYTSAQNGNNFINTIAQDDSVSVRGTKTWRDPAGTEHPTITINLLRDGEEIASTTLANGTTDYSFTGLPKYDLTDGHVYEYTVTEDEVAGYTSVQNGNNFINTIAQENSVSVSGTKTWIAPAGTEHPTITISLLRDGVRVDSTTLANGTTEYSFTDLPKYDLTDGHIYSYTVREEPVEGYTSTQNGNNFTNTIAQDNSVSVSGAKTWADPDADHPTITIRLYRDGKEIDSTTLANGTTSYSFTGLPKYDLTDGHIYSYTVSEDLVEGYTSVQSGNDFTNTPVKYPVYVRYHVDDVNNVPIRPDYYLGDYDYNSLLSLLESSAAAVKDHYYGLEGVVPVDAYNRGEVQPVAPGKIVDSRDPAENNIIHVVYLPKGSVTVYNVTYTDGLESGATYNGGSRQPGANYSVLGNTVTGFVHPEGAEFIGWREISGFGVSTVIGNMAQQPEGNVVYEAVWRDKGPSLIVTYHSNYQDAALPDAAEVTDNNGGSGYYQGDGFTTYTVGDGKDITTFAKPGYHFIGWAVEPAGGVAVAPAADMTMPGMNVDLYAVWSPNTQIPERVSVSAEHNYFLDSTTGEGQSAYGITPQSGEIMVGNEIKYGYNGNTYDKKDGTVTVVKSPLPVGIDPPEQPIATWTEELQAQYEAAKKAYDDALLAVKTAQKAVDDATKTKADAEAAKQALAQAENALTTATANYNQAQALAAQVAESAEELNAALAAKNAEITAKQGEIDNMPEPVLENFGTEEEFNTAHEAWTTEIGKLNGELTTLNTEREELERKLGLLNDLSAKEIAKADAETALTAKFFGAPARYAAG